MEFEDSKVLEIFAPDDFHHHLRDGNFLECTVYHASREFGRIIAMPNLKPPIRTTLEATDYKKRILESCSLPPDFEVMMTLYLTDLTTPEEIVHARTSGIVYAVKYYPAGATTNSEFGVSNIENVKQVLKTMSDVGLPLLIHGEVTDPEVDVFDREKVFIDTILVPLIAEFPDLKIVMEHITTAEAAEFIMSQPSTVKLSATITAHHLLYNRNHIFRGGVQPHMYCLPILKREHHRLALLKAATSGNPRFFLGTDSAPHAVETKETTCGCAGIFTGHAALELYAEAFDSMGALDKLEGFCSIFGANFYGIPVQSKLRRKLVKQPWTVPSSYPFGDSAVRPLRAGETIQWSIVE